MREDRVAEADPASSGETVQQPEPPVRSDPPKPSRRHGAESSRKPGRQAQPSRAEADTQRTPDDDAAEEEAKPLKHVLRRGQTLYSVAKMYGVEVPALMKANGIKNARHVSANTLLVIPVTRSARGAAPGAKPAGVVQASIAPGVGPPDDEDSPSTSKKNAVAGEETRAADQPALAWPLHGAVTAAYGRRGKSDHHEGIDIDGQTGDPIQAAASGTVAFAGTHGDYGRTVVIDHGEGWRTVYAHASELKVQEGDPVRVGDTIAEVGHSGNARGSHLHFEVRRDGRAQNPIPYLRSTDTLTAGVVPTPKPKSKTAKKGTSATKKGASASRP